MIYQKILNVMKEIQALQKDMAVGSGQYSYRAISETKVTGEVRKSLIKHELVFYQSEILKNELIDLTIEGKSKFMSLVTVRYILADAKPKDNSALSVIQVESIGSGIDSQDKATGKALTYAYKYALLRLFAIPTGEDPDKKASVDSSGKMKLNDKQFQALIGKVQTGEIQITHLENNFTLTDVQQEKLNQLL